MWLSINKSIIKDIEMIQLSAKPNDFFQLAKHPFFKILSYINEKELINLSITNKYIRDVVSLYLVEAFNRDIYHRPLNNPYEEPKLMENLVELKPMLCRGSFFSSNSKRIVDFFRGVYTNNLPHVSDYLSNNGDPNVYNQQGLTALHIACANNYIHIVELLINAKANIYVNANNKTKETPCHTAAFHGHIEIVKLLTNTVGITKIVKAFSGSSVFGIGILQDYKHSSPVDWAAASDQVNVVKFFVENGYPIERKFLIGDFERLDRNPNTSVFMDLHYYRSFFSGYLVYKRNLLLIAGKYNAFNVFDYLVPSLLKNKKCLSQKCQPHYPTGTPSYNKFFFRPKIQEHAELTSCGEKRHDHCFYQDKLMTLLAVLIHTKSAGQLIRHFITKLNNNDYGIDLDQNQKYNLSCLEKLSHNDGDITSNNFDGNYTNVT